MNDRQEPHDMLDQVAVYALGALPATQAQAVRDHMATCAQCRDEYDQLRGAVAAIALTAEAPQTGAQAPSTLLKARIMRQVKTSANGSDQRSTDIGTAPGRSGSGPVWPAYLVAAACLAFAIISSVYNIILSGQLNAGKQEVARLSQRDTALSKSLTEERGTLSDVLSADSKHYVVGENDVVTRGSHVYIAMRGLPEPPRGHVYQAWSLPKGAKKMVPSVTFVPDRGVAVVTVTADARDTAAVAVSIEPDGGSKQPTSKPVLVVPLT